MPRHEDLLMGAEILAEIPQSAPEEDDEELQGIVRRAIEDAVQWREEHLDEDMAEATEYYHARPLGNEKKGRSQVVDPTVRDTILGIMPSLLRIFFGSEKVVEFKPDQEERRQEAALQTKYVQWIVAEDNPGFITFHSAFKDALIRKLGIIKWWWEDTPFIEGDEYTGLTADEVEVLQMTEPDEIVEFEATEVPPATPEWPPTFDVTMKRRVRQGRVRIMAVPPEEFIYTPGSRSLADADMAGHLREVTADELVTMGFDRELIEKHKGRTDQGHAEGLKQAREVDDGYSTDHDDTAVEARRKVRFADLYMHLETEEGETELRHIQALGDTAEIVSNTPASRKPFALFGPDPEPHTMVGLSIADYVMDLQRINSQLLRGILDSLAQHLDPATAVVDGEVNMKDLLNPEPNRFVRVNRPGMLESLSQPFLGNAALQVREAMEVARENRTGQSRAAAGLDADALQSSTKLAVAGTLSAGQQRIEMIARIFCETGMKDLMLGILETVVQNQNAPRMMEVNGEFIPIDPRQWKVTKHVSIHVALGAGMTEDKLRALQMIKETQEQYIMNGVPFVNFTHLRNTNARIAELAGFTDTTEFWDPWDEQKQQEFEQMQAQQAAEQGGDEEVQALVQVEMAKLQQAEKENQEKMQWEQMKAQADLQNKTADRQAQQQERAQALLAQKQQKAAELELRLRDSMLKDERERTRMMLDYRIRVAQLGQEEADRALKAEIEAAKLGLEAETAGVKGTRELAAMIRDLAELEMEVEEAQERVASTTPQDVDRVEEPALK